MSNIGRAAGKVEDGPLPGNKGSKLKTEASFAFCSNWTHFHIWVHPFLLYHLPPYFSEIKDDFSFIEIVLKHCFSNYGI